MSNNCWRLMIVENLLETRGVENSLEFREDGYLVFGGVCYSAAIAGVSQAVGCAAGWRCSGGARHYFPAAHVFQPAFTVV